MIQIIAENEQGLRWNLSKEKDVQLIKVTGLTPPVATIYSHSLPTSDGDKYNRSRTEKRNIVLIFAPSVSPENGRMKIYNIFKIKRYIKLYFKTKNRDVYTEGYIETIDGDLFENPQKIQISIICHYPYFKQKDDVITSFTTVNSFFEFPFAIEEEGIEFSESVSMVEKKIYNDSDNEVGIIIELEAVGRCLEPTIYNRSTGKSFSFKADLFTGDRVVINTNPGQKSIKLYHEGVESNIINNIHFGSKWLDLQVGENIFTYTCAEGVDNLRMSFKTNLAYGGL